MDIPVVGVVVAPKAGKTNHSAAGGGASLKGETAALKYGVCG